MKIQKLYYNGSIYTMSTQGEKVEAIGCSNGKIVFLGNAGTDIILQAQELVNLQGKTVLPGFIDTHIHCGASIIRKNALDLSKTSSNEEVFHICSDAAKSCKNEKFLYATNYNENQLFDADPALLKQYIDSLQIPLIINSNCLHKYIINKAALSYLKKYYTTMNISRAHFESGIFIDQEIAEIRLLLREIYNQTEDKYNIIKHFIFQLNKSGLTSINTFEACDWAFFENIEIYLDLYKKQCLNMSLCLNSDKMSSLKKFKSIENDQIKAGALKIYVDGSLASRTAAMNNPYNDDPFNRGILWYNKDKIEEYVKLSLENGFPVAFHAIGDRAFKIVLDIVNTYNLIEPRIIHAQILDKNLINEAAELPVHIDIQPHFINDDMKIAETRLGKKRLQTSYCYKDMKESHLNITGGSDWPADSFEPLKGIFCAVNQSDESFNTWKNNQQLSVFEAISLYTSKAAQSLKGFCKKGTLELGNDADMVILKDDPFKVQKTLLKDIVICETIAHGYSVYCSGKE